MAREKHNLEKELLKKQIETEEKNQLNLGLDNYNKILDIVEKGGFNEINQVKNPYLQKQLQEAREKVIYRFNASMNKNDLTFQSIETRRIDTSI
ncbi:hypothetical protein [Bacillus pumilus]|uniref:hypothetical protein n=1 Tax=Bacillus pumilus TaxID=1408 RepID=UPI001CD6E22D|nr:hypothetical protein [Bacillus pumilus]